MTFAWKASGITYVSSPSPDIPSIGTGARPRNACGAGAWWLTLVSDSYNRYLAVASRAVRRSLKEDKRIVAERRGEMELRFAKWTVS